MKNIQNIFIVCVCKVKKKNFRHCLDRKDLFWMSGMFFIVFQKHYVPENLLLRNFYPSHRFLFENNLKIMISIMHGNLSRQSRSLHFESFYSEAEKLFKYLPSHINNFPALGYSVFVYRTATNVHIFPILA